MFERKYRRSAEQTKDSDLEEFIWRCVLSLTVFQFVIMTLFSPPAPKAKMTHRRKVSEKEAPAQPDRAPRSPTTSTKAAPAPVAAAPVERSVQLAQKPAAPSSSTSIPNAEEIVSKEAVLYLWDTTRAQFDTQGVFTASIYRRTDEAFNYSLAAHNGDYMLLAHRISSDMNPKWTHRMLSITWNHLNADGSGNSWCLRFATAEDYAEMSEVFVRCLWETLHQVSWEKIKEDEQRYVMSSTEDVEMKDVSDEENEEDEVLSELEVDKGELVSCSSRQSLM